tara:strand:+ start:81 stop:506 length:426 start_codon:yes stop_codon:yes gene_type:complete
MATINATISVNSDIMSYPININTSMVMNKSQSCHGLEETSGMNVKKFNAVTATKIIDNTEGTADKASKVYIRNTGSSKTNFFYVAFNASAAAAATVETIGKLYGGDWMLIPWTATAATTHDIIVAPNTTEEMTLEWMVFQE